MKRPDIEAIRERILYAREGDIKSAMEIALYDAEDLFAYIEELETRLETRLEKDGIFGLDRLENHSGGSSES